MKPLPLPVRVAAGLAVAAVERARQLPQQLAGLPVTVVSEALQLSMRVQQQVTELAIKGDDLLSALRPVEETPEWATFDEDEPAEPDEPASPPRAAAGTRTGVTFATKADDLGETETEIAPDPWTVEEQALADAERVAEETEESEAAAAAEAARSGEPEQPEQPGADQGAGTGGPAALPGYDALSLPQVRARMRGLSVDELEQLLAHERSHAARPAFVGMLTRRIATVRAQRAQS